MIHFAALPITSSAAATFGLAWCRPKYVSCVTLTRR